MVNLQEQKNNNNLKETVIINSNNSSILERAENSAVEVAKYFLSLDPTRQYFTKNVLKFEEDELTEGNFRLNKMLHMAQIFYCVKYQKPLFKEIMTAFDHGAVVTKVYANFYQLYGVLRPTFNLTPVGEEFAKKIFYYFKKNDDKQLRDFSHQDPAWELGKEDANELMPLTEKLITYYNKFFDDTLKDIEERNDQNKA